ncbi:MAG: DUF86 domain-containing protein [Prevotella sp.]|nr:DUF86 domain-containing protein [Prevotella sp.]
MYSSEFTIHDRLEEILESIELIQEWSRGRTTSDDYMLSPNGVMAFKACVMRIQVIGEQVGKLLKAEQQPLKDFPQIPWLAIYDMRNFISHEYANIDEDLVVSVINNDIPQLKEVINKLLNQY